MKSVFVSKALLAAVIGAVLCSSNAFAADKGCSDKACGANSKECAKKGKHTEEPAKGSETKASETKASETKAEAAKAEEKPAK
ncbi:MAG: hypothetical protein KGS72_16105 [Cyanobacteria bacterium REEB67]|nr:hypothetical protein [Cyanobacteria bacterium REEB67]